MQLDLFTNNHNKVEVESVEVRCCKDCGKEKDINKFFLQYYKKDGNPTYGYVCLDCKGEQAKLVKILRKENWPPPDCCESCGKERPLLPDHDHLTKAFRGWICRNCNVGFGHFGDTVEGMEKALNYMKKTNERD